jgi:8-oxo-dGTP pyrophosphatase MutT (NUDIX family)
VAAALVYRMRPAGRTHFLARRLWKAEFLIVRRSHDDELYPDIWVAPGGSLSEIDFAGNHETALTKTLSRELSEEIGSHLAVGKPNLFSERSLWRSDHGGIVVLTYAVPWINGEPVLTPEVAATAWVTAREASTFNLFGSTLAEIELADRILRTRSGFVSR